MANRRKKRKIRKSQRKYQKYSIRRSVLRDPYREDLRDVEDRRTYRPGWIEGHRKTDGTPVDYRATDKHYRTGRAIRLGLSRIGFADPRRVIVCRRRHKRRRALFAKKIIGRGKGGTGFKRRIMREISRVRC